MSSDKKSLLQILGIPNEFSVVLLTLALILLISPYIGGADFGVIKVPVFSLAIKRILYILGPIFFLGTVILFLPLVKQNNAPPSLARSVDNNSKYRLQSIIDIVRVEAANYGLQIDGIKIGDRLHIDDLERFCIKAWYPEKSEVETKKILMDARIKAFSRKYAEPREDEKLVDISNIQFGGLKPWEVYFIDLLKDLGVKDLKEIDVLNVGIGNGHAEEPFLNKLHSFKAVDISEEALQYADKKYSQMTRFVCAAEDLSYIPNNSVDLYMSLRTYPSTLFNRRIAIHEAYRVLRNGGIIVLSIPFMYLKEKGEVLTGLIPPGSTVPNAEYARDLAKRIKDHLITLNFHDAKIDERSPFEIFISARL